MSDARCRYASALGLTAFAAAFAIVTPGSVAAQPAPQDNHSQAARWFYEQRAYPFDKVPQDALQKARVYYDRAWPGSRQPLQGALSVNNWGPIGPAPITNTGWSQFFGNFDHAGRITTFAVDFQHAGVIYIGGAQGGVWKTTDGGVTWAPLTDTQCSLAMGSISLDPTNTLIVYAGTGEWNGGVGDTYYGCGVLRSADGGATWTQLGASVFAGANGRARIQAIAVDPNTPSHVLAASSLGLYRSTDSGTTWTRVLGAADGTTPISDLAFAPGNASTVYAAIGNVQGSTSNGIYMSTDGGATFNKVQTFTGSGRISFAIAPTNNQIIYAAVETAGTHQLNGLFQSTNGGQNFNPLAGAAVVDCGFQCFYDMYVAVDPTNANTVYFGGFSLFKSTDGGGSFVDIGRDNTGKAIIHVDQHAFAFGSNNQTVYAVNDGGIYKSTDGGTTWTGLNTNLALAQFYPGISQHPTAASAFGGTQDNGIMLYTGSVAWTSLPKWGDGGFTAVDFNTPTTAYSEQSSGPFREINFPSQNKNDWVAATGGINLNDPKVFVATPIVMSPTNSLTLYYGTCRAYQTTDGGQNWAPSADLSKTGNTCGNPNARTGLVTTIAEAKSNPQVVYVGLNDGNVQVTTNGGNTFTPIINGLPNRAVTYVAVDPTNAQNAFVVFSGFSGTTNPSAHVFRTTNTGASWTDISGNLPDIPVNAILVDPAAPTTRIFIGTDLGVFQSKDGGATWTPFNASMPNVAVFDLSYNLTTGLLVAATHGRGAWMANFGGGPAAVTHDFNDDGKSDIAWRDNGGTRAMWLMNGTQIATIGSFGVIPPNWVLYGQRDFNGDGNHDWLWRDANSGTVLLWFLRGTQILGTANLGAIPTNWTIVGTGDVNADGKGDLLWRDNLGTLAIWQLSGSAITKSAVLGNVSNVWTVVGFADFNGDRKADILWRDNQGNIAIWFMNGTQILSTALLGNISTNWSVVGTGDFNGDNKADVLWRDTSGNVAIWLMNGGQVTGAVVVGNIPTNWAVQQTGDFNGDTKCDVLWRATNGDVAIWFMNGLQISQVSLLGNIPTNWSIQNINVD